MSQSSTKKRSTLLRNSSSNRDAISNKKQKLECSEPAATSTGSGVFSGNLYWHGDTNHIHIHLNKDEDAHHDIMGVLVKIEMTDHGLQLIHVTKMDNKEERYKDTLDSLNHELKKRREDMEFSSQEIDKLMRSLQNEEEMTDDEMNHIFQQVKVNALIGRTHKQHIMQHIRKTSVHFKYNQTYRPECSVFLKPGRLCRVPFLPHAVCWYPDGMTLEAERLTPPPVQVTEIHEEVPYGLGEDECKWLTKVRFSHINSGLSKADETLKLNQYIEAAEAGNSYGRYLLGFCYFWGLLGVDDIDEDEKEAFKLFTLSAEDENAWGQFGLGECYFDGDGVDQNTETGIDWYTLAAKQGNSYAQYRLGQCYFDGDGVDQNTEEALQWYTLAAKQGHQEAQYHLGECYYYGIRVDQNKETAVEWYTLAAKQGHQEAQDRLDDIF